MEATMKVFSSVYTADDSSRLGRRPGQGLTDAKSTQLENEKIAADIFEKSGTKNWTWQVGSA